ncbi:MAG TPA: DUF4360 domain-containing protein [Oligoflexus sp.]|uniref:DUF4360 domain-containing protein n=1 Tax=Oligoflexus sp. TaxID=1971216 RepID=UPI002D69320C|nr:DUF4360 domain-containing protein [Oligoflexus sp.]HYX32696.1 DUF4360 domain-containing protein [Oligoflexus sp.]
MKWNQTLGLLIFVTGAAQAAEVQVNAFSSNGGCGTSPSFDVVETSALNPKTNTKGESLRVFFNDFFLSTTYAGTVNKNCVLDAQVKIPAGYRFRPVSAAAEGSYNLQPQGQSQGFIRVSYEVQPNGWSAEAANQTPFTGQGDINCIAKLDEELVLGCSTEDTLVNLHTNIDLSIQQNSSSFSQMDIDASRQNHDLSWKWELFSCSIPFEDRDFKTTYVAYSGQSIPATVHFSGSQGTFVASGLNGQFTEVRYSNRGRSVQGKWSAGNSGGTFTFSLINDSTGEFQGTWRDAKNPNQGGAWNGRYQ